MKLVQYWHNVLKVIDAIVVDPDIKSADKLLSFIDSKNVTSGLKIVLMMILLKTSFKQLGLQLFGKAVIFKSC